MVKFCIFCGQHPEGKNKEHVLPRWLIEQTGDPKRRARFGINFDKNPPEFREFSFDALTFPACSRCNADFSKLEERAKTVIEKLLGHQALSQQDFSTLLDWLDKVRVGLWLGYFYLDRNPAGIFPKYHIASRMGQMDRTTAIIHIDRKGSGIHFLGPESPAFQFTPTCVALVINQWCLLNTSGISSCSRRLGFPYLRPKYFREDGSLEVTVEEGSGRIMRPVQKDLILRDAAIIHQPIFRNGFAGEKARRLIDTPQIRTHSVNWTQGFGPVFFETRDYVRRYPDDRSLDWLPSKSWSLEEAYNTLAPLVHRRLIRDLEEGANLCGKERRKSLQKKIALIRQVHEAMRSTLPRGPH